MTQAQGCVPLLFSAACTHAGLLENHTQTCFCLRLLTQPEVIGVIGIRSCQPTAISQELLLVCDPNLLFQLLVIVASVVLFFSLPSQANDCHPAPAVHGKQRDRPAKESQRYSSFPVWPWIQEGHQHPDQQEVNITAPAPHSLPQT